MPSLGFKRRWAGKVRDGVKRHTFRKERKRPINVGDKLIMFCGMRTKNCERLGTHICTVVLPGRLDANGNMIIDGRWLSGPEVEAFAVADGFAGCGEFRDWFEKQYGLPFDGVVLYW